ncbi:unnamed protein product [Ceratitis capitata]|uniref:(Mediterranean fruit fly) hypothetical protein n=1 Tax=Ceratitis capitata TaxID=7213 RepID=A0A811UB71_CERCA|nr:unnamed protein product [Ceratitis capitata]
MRTYVKAYESQHSNGFSEFLRGTFSRCLRRICTACRFYRTPVCLWQRQSAKSFAHLRLPLDILAAHHFISMFYFYIFFFFFAVVVAIAMAFAVIVLATAALTKSTCGCSFAFLASRSCWLFICEHTHIPCDSKRPRMRTVGFVV